MGACDATFKTCVALHNMLLEWNGGDEVWQHGVTLPSTEAEAYLGELGLHDVEDYDIDDRFGSNKYKAMFGRLFTEARNLGEDRFRSFDAVNSSVARQNLMSDIGPPPVHLRRRTLDEQENVHQVCTYHRDVFRDALVEHWDIVWRRREVVWPCYSRLGPNIYE